MIRGCDHRPAIKFSSTGGMISVSEGLQSPIRQFGMMHGSEAVIDTEYCFAGIQRSRLRYTVGYSLLNEVRAGVYKSNDGDC